jgi:hypothetical protein
MPFDQIIIRQAIQQSARAAPVAVADGDLAGRIELIVDAVDWAAGMQVTVTAECFDDLGNSLVAWSAILSIGRDRSGNLLSPYLEFQTPGSQPNRTLVVSLDADRTTNIGLRLCTAAAVTQLPEPLAPPR